MRWNKEPEPKNYAERQVRKFLIFPKTIDLQTRWLEYATITQKYFHTEGWLDYRWD